MSSINYCRFSFIVVFRFMSFFSPFFPYSVKKENNVSSFITAHQAVGHVAYFVNTSITFSFSFSFSIFIFFLFFPSQKNGANSSVRLGDEARRNPGHSHRRRQRLLFLSLPPEKSPALPVSDRRIRRYTRRLQSQR